MTARPVVADFYVESQKVSKRRILYINFSFPPMSVPGIWRALSFTKYLVQFGYDVTVLCADRSWNNTYDETLLVDMPPKMRIKRLKSISLADILQKMEHVARKSRFRLLSKILEGMEWRIARLYPEPNFLWCFKATLAGVFLALSRRIDCVITSGPPHICHIPGLMISKCTRVPWIMDYRDLWTDDPDLSPQSGYQKRLFQVIEAYATRHADAVTTVSPGWQRHLKSRFSGTTKSDRFFLIRNGHNLDKFTFEYHNGPHYDGRLHIHFNGTLQILAKTTSVLDALYKLRSDDIRGGTLPIVTFTGIDDLFMKEIRSRNLEDIILDVGYMTYYQSIMYSLSCDVLLIIVNNDNPSRWGTIPRKTYEYMALGRHILAVVPFESDVRELLKEYGNATVCDVDDPDDICNALMKLITLHGEHKLNTNLDVGKREMALEKYSMEHHTRQLISLIEALPKKK